MSLFYFNKLIKFDMNCIKIINIKYFRYIIRAMECALKTSENRTIRTQPKIRLAQLRVY